MVVERVYYPIDGNISIIYVYMFNYVWNVFDPHPSEMPFGENIPLNFPFDLWIFYWRFIDI